ncbi:MAG: hybrid sensor histidine kinase/response regulator [Deltaproteobacteria bacterium]|nr:hybrid sensor histidine kinase/response regulator [Deltaproteobacteria bacterium]
MALVIPKKQMDPILIVDDEKDNLQALHRLLRPLFKVTECLSPIEALKLVQKNEYHVVVSDQRMAEMPGVDLLEKVKSIAPDTTRILLTGYTDIESVIAAINRGHIYRYIAKPWDPEELKIILRQANEAYCLRRELARKNEDLSRSNQKLEKALEELKRLDRAKARFLSLISHELNTPLTVLSSYAGLLTQKKEELPMDAQKASDAIQSACDRFASIINEVLTFVKLESGGDYRAERFDVAKELRLIREGFQQDIVSKNIAFKVVDSAQAKLSCDPEKMRLGFRKLIENALMLSPKNREVRLSISRQNGNVVCSLWRAGETLSEHALAALEPPGNELRHQKGLGLGLAICKLIVEGHGGEMKVTSDSAAGTLITLFLPSEE